MEEILNWEEVTLKIRERTYRELSAKIHLLFYEVLISTIEELYIVYFAHYCKISIIGYLYDRMRERLVEPGRTLHSYINSCLYAA